MNSIQSKCTDLMIEVRAWIAGYVASFQTDTAVLDKQHLLKEVQRVFPSIELDERQILILIVQAWQETKSGTYQRTSEQWTALFPRYPIRQDGFALAFQPDQSSQILETFQEFGLVVVQYTGEDVTSFYSTHQRWHPGKVFSEYRDVFAIERIELLDLGRKLLGLEDW